MEIWKLTIKFYSIPVYDEKYIKAKVKEFYGVIKTNFWSNKKPKEGVHHTCIAYITTVSVMRLGKKISTSLFRRRQIWNKKDKNDWIYRR